MQIRSSGGEKMTRKLALIIGNSEYEDGNLARLITPDTDVNALAEVLRDVEIGGFDEVSALVNQPSTVIRRAISSFFLGRGREDLMLLYFSGHGIRDDRGQLFLAVKDTDHNLLRGTAIPATFITEEMDNSRSRQQVLILDCCHSGAFSHGMKAATGASVGTAAAFVGTGSGRVVLTATDSTQYAWEGDQVIGQAENSVFTHYLVKGLCSGEADIDADGEITLDELYNYVYEQVVNETPMQTPGKWSYGQKGEIVIARNPSPVVKPAELPPDLHQTIEDPRPWVREGAVQELDRLLRGNNPGLAAAAREALVRLLGDDSRRVATMASESLATVIEKESKPKTVNVEAQPKQNEKEIQKPAVQEGPESLREIQEKATQAVMAERHAGQERLTQKQPEEKRKAVETIEEKVEQRTGSRQHESAFNKLVLSPAGLITAGWAILWAIGWVIADYLGWGGDALTVIWTLLWALRGGIAGLVIQHVNPLVKWEHILAISMGWPVASIIGAAISKEIYGTGYVPVIGIVFGLVGGLISGLVLMWADRSIRWTDVLIITIGWCVSVAISELSGQPLYDSAVNSYVGPRGLLVIPGAIQGALAGIIGSSTMFWQLGQVRRRR
jgi:hypothetical protein